MNPEIWRYVFDAIEDPIFLHDAEYRLLLANRAYCRATGVSEADALGKLYWEIFPRGSGPLPGCLAAASGKGDTGSEDEVSVGAKLFISKGYTVRDDKGDFLYALHVLSDVTAQRQGMAKLVESEEHFRLIAETITEAFWMADVALGKMYYISPAYEHIWGRSTQSLYENPSSFVEAIHPDDVARVLADFELEKTGQPFDHEYRIRRPDGTLRWIWDRGFPIHEPTGEVLRYVGIAQDITERKQAENQLRLFRELFDCSNDGFYVLDPANGRIVDVNEATCRSLGYTRDELLQLNVVAIQTSLPDVAAWQPYVQSLRAQNVSLIEVEQLRKDGSRFPTEINFHYASAMGRDYIVSSARDITERKQAESRLADQLVELRQWHDATLGREMRILDLKYEVNELLGKSGLPARYPSAESQDQTEE